MLFLSPLNFNSFFFEFVVVLLSPVDVSPFKSLKKPVTVETIKADKRLENIGLVRQGRLSVMKLTAYEFDLILELSEA